MSRPDQLKRPARILHVINDLSIGGAEVMLLSVLARVDRSRFEPVVISLMDCGDVRTRIERLGIAVQSPGMTPQLPSPAAWLRFFRLVRSAKPDLVHGWMHHASLASQIARLLGRTRAPVVWNIHGSVYSLAHEKPMTARVIRLGAHLSESALLVGHVGRYHPMKDHANLLRALAGLRRRFADAHLLLVGRGVRADTAALSGLASQLGLADAVHMAGERDDVKRLAASLDIFALSSSHGEGFPLAVGEAMACGVPAVVTDVGDAAVIVGDTGRVVPPSDHTALTEALASLADLGPSGLAALGRAARCRIGERFSIAEAVERYEQLYAKVLNRSPAPR